MTRVALQTASRVGAVQLLENYCATVTINPQIYRARPKQAKPPTFYVESIAESLTEYTLTTRQRLTRVRVRCLWGLYDSGDAVDQRDRFVDGFLDWVADNYHAFGANTLVEAAEVADDPEFDFDGTSYFSSVITLGGFAAT